MRDPQRLASALRDAGLPYPRTFAAAPAIARAAGCASRCAAAAAPACASGAAARCRPGTVVQERIDGVPCSAAAVGDGVDAVVLGLTEQLVGRRAFGVRGYRWCGNLVPPRRAADALLEQARAICSCLAAAFALRGLFGVDFVWDGERAWTIEVNPRPTASLEAIEAAYGVGVFDAHLRGCAGELPQVEPARGGAAGKAVLFATEDVIVGDSERWLARGVRDVPHPGERIAAGQSDLHGRRDRGDARGRAGRARGAGGAAARRAAGWRWRRVADATCAGCGCACDDIEATVADGRLSVARTCALGDAWFAERAGRPPIAASTAAR